MVNSFIKIYQDLRLLGKIVYPRELMVLEIENYHYQLQPRERFVNFQARHLNLSYIKQEFMWYLNGDPTDISITEYAKLWKTMINGKGIINSNYGQYIFPNQFNYVVKELVKDKDSRRASMVILNSNHLLSGDADLPCTYALNFRIRQNQLNMTVHMRSQDAILGLANDVPFFSFVHEMIYHYFTNQYSLLTLGYYDHFVDSLHVYEKHLSMLEEIVTNPIITPIDCPEILNKDEVKFLI